MVVRKTEGYTVRLLIMYQSTVFTPVSYVSKKIHPVYEAVCAFVKLFM